MRVALLILLLASASPAAVDAQAVLSELRSADYAARQKATQGLLADTTLTQEELRKLYQGATLPEQRQRLLDVARHHLLRQLQEQASRPGGQGSLGLTLVAGLTAEQVPEAGRPAARVGTTYPGFPAYVALRPGDLILAINDQGGPPAQDESTIRARFIELVKANPAGTTIRLTILREGKTLEATVRLASFDALTSIYEVGGIDGEGLRAAFDQRWLDLRRELSALAPEGEPLKVDSEKIPEATAEPRPARLNEAPVEEGAGGNDE